MPDSDKPRFQGIADPKCKCTPERLCLRCSPPLPDSDAARYERVKKQFRGKFREPWNDAVKKNNNKEG